MNFIEEDTAGQKQLNKVEQVHKALKHGVITNAEGSQMRCIICNVKLNDQFTLLAMHLSSSEHHLAVSNLLFVILVISLVLSVQIVPSLLTRVASQ